MLGKNTRIEYTGIDDYVVTGLFTIKPFAVRGLVGSPALALAGAFVYLLTVTPATAANARSTVWLCVMTALCLWGFAMTLFQERPLIGPSSSEFSVLAGYRSAVTGHVVELQTVLDASDEVRRVTRRQRKRVDAVVKQTQYVATLFLLAARAETPGDVSWWERIQMDDTDELHHTLTEQDSRLMEMRREVLNELRGASRVAA